ncbi:MAG: hypothetical protein JWQ52_491 [Phenylobacterium sp.]|nr:hypothetical protein [Phenylobacterium sp.]
MVWLLTLAKLLWRASDGRTAHLPKTVGPLQSAAAHAAQSGLYLLLMLQPDTGLLRASSAGGRSTCSDSTFRQ